jgi:TetR/AcrR family transcriptional regulator, lmrAB and yxaGH operons repressor
MTIEAPIPNTRDRLISAMLGALRTRGYHGVGLNEVLATAGAPKGVLYHHFPGGKAELAVAAIDAVVTRLSAELDSLLARHGDPVLALDAWMKSAQKMLEKSGFDRGCPLATVALETTSEDEALRHALAQGFAAMRARLKQVLEQSGMAAASARACAALIVSAYEGALLQARVAGSAQVMRDTSQALMAMVRLSLRDSAEPKPKAKLKR